jgi:transglutaminase-like putative cysteine protease
MYFRGPVLSDYDGERWRVAPEPDNAGPAGFPTQVASRIDYEITFEPLRISFLPLLEHTLLRPRASPAATPEMSGLAPAVDSAGQWRLRTPLAERVRLQASAWPVARRQVDLPLLRQRELVQLPAGFHPRTLAWAAALHARPELREADASTLAGAVLAHIRREAYTYTLQPGAYEGDTVDEFWLDRRQGFCEHFSVAFVVVMRALDVPARIVTGYQGSDELPVDDYLIVRQSHAHAWAEYWQAGKGWIRADPTAAVAPERILRSLDLRAPAGLMGAIDTVSPGLRLGLRRWFEGLDNRWNQWVLGYGRQQQFKLLDGLGWPEADALSLTRLLVTLMAGVGLSGAAWAWWDARRRSPWQTLQARVRAELALWDIHPEASDSPALMAEQLAARHGGRAAPLVAELQALERLRYARPVALAPTRPVDLVAWWRGFRRQARAARRGGARGTG